jgi:uncharacterized Zn-finger protein
MRRHGRPPDHSQNAGAFMIHSRTTPDSAYEPPETVVVDIDRVSCEGQGGALGHPKVWYLIGDSGFVECKYCDRRFVLRGGPADAAGAAS